MNIEDTPFGVVSKDQTLSMLNQAMDANSALQAMGLVGADKLGYDPVAEQKQLAEDMERKNREEQLRRARLVSGGQTPLPNQPESTAAEQKPVKKRGKKGMVKQETPLVLGAQPKAPIQPAVTVPEIPDESQVPHGNYSGMTQKDIELIESVKRASVMRSQQYFDGPVPQQQVMQQPVQAAPLPAPAPVPPAPPRPQPQPQPQPIGNTYPQQVAAYAMAPDWALPEVPQQAPVQAPAPSPAPAYQAPAYQPPAYVPPQPQVRAVEPAPEVQNIPQQKVERVPFVPGANNGDFNAFTEITYWPSHGVAYPDRIYGQAFKADDFWMLDDMDDSNRTSTMDTILAKHLRGVNVGDILTADEEYLLHWFRASSYPDSPIPPVPFRCSHCGSVYANDGSLAMVPPLSFADMSFELAEAPENIIALHEDGHAAITLPDGRGCHVYLRRRKHDTIINQYVDEWENTYRKAYPAHLAVPTNFASFIEIEDLEGMSEKVEYLRNLPLPHRSAVEKAIVSVSMRGSTQVTYTCPRCGGSVTVPYPFRWDKYISSLQ